MSEAFKEITNKHEKRNNFLEKEARSELKVKSENKANLEASSRSIIPTKSPISNGTPTIIAGQAVLHQTTIHYNRPIFCSYVYITFQAQIIV